MATPPNGRRVSVLKRAGLDPADFPAVQMESNLLGFQAPQYIPGNPHRLPPKNARVRFPENTLIGNDLPGTPDIVPSPGGNPPLPLLDSPPLDSAWIIDPHHYASVRSQSGVPGIAGSASVGVAFLLQPDTKRNFLSLRNASAVANIYIDFGKPASAFSPILLTPGQTVLFDTVVPQDDLYALADAAAASLIWGYSQIPLGH